MNIKYTYSGTPRVIAGLLAAWLGCASATAAAQGLPVDLAQTPLASGDLSPNPNVLVLADDSRSMDWEFIWPGDGVEPVRNSVLEMPRGGFAYKHLFSIMNVHPLDNDDGKVLPFCETLDLPAYEGHQWLVILKEFCWKGRNSKYNRLYYSHFERDQDLNETTELTQYESWGGNYPGGRDNDGNFIDPLFYTRVPISPGSNVTFDITNVQLAISASIPENVLNPPDNGGETYNYPPGQNLAFYHNDAGEKVQLTDAQELNNFAVWFTYHRRRMYTAQSGLAAFAKDVQGINLGLSTISGKNRVQITDAVDRNDLLQNIFAMTSNASTPLVSALYKAGRYFECTADSKFYAGNIMNAKGECLMPASKSASACQKNYTVLMTDGYWSDGDKAPIGDVDSAGGPFAGAPFADGIDRTLADVAMHFYSTDLSPADNSVPPDRETPDEPGVDETRVAAASTYWDTNTTMHQHMKTMTLGFGVRGSPDVPWPTLVDGVWTGYNWPDAPIRNQGPEKIDDLVHAAFNGRGSYVSANNTAELKAALDGLTRSLGGSGAASAVSFNSQQIGSDTYIYRADYNAVSNSGDVQAYSITSTETEPFGVSDTAAWSAAEQLEQQLEEVRAIDACTGTADERVIATYGVNALDGSNSGVPFLVTSDAAPGLFGLSAAEVDWLRGHRYPEASSGCITSAGLRDRDDDKLLGDIDHSRPLWIGPPSMPRRNNAPFPTAEGLSYAEFVQPYVDMDGDTTPGEEDTPETGKRHELVLVGANDGFFHSFDALTGKELFAYAPRVLIDGSDNRLADLTKVGYQHQYYVDLPPAVNDAFWGNQWHTVVIGGLRAGGKGYFGLDVTDMNNYGNEEELSESVLWEFTDRSVPEGDRLGKTFSTPQIVMSNVKGAGGENKWFAILGNGYNSDAGNAELIILDIEGGEDGTWDEADYRFITPKMGANDLEPAQADETKNGLSTPRAVDIDENGTVDYVYAGDLHGNIHKYDLTASGNMSEFTGKILFTASDPTDQVQPITTQVITTRHPVSPQTVLVVATTGSWFQQSDVTNTDVIHSVYGVWDRPGRADSLSRDDLTERQLINKLETLNGVDVVLRTFANNQAPLAWYEELTGSGTHGWHIDFDMPRYDAAETGDGSAEYPGEKPVREMAMKDGFIFVNTIIPGLLDGCEVAIKGATLGFDPKTGSLATALFANNGSSGEEITAGEVLEGVPSNPAIIGNTIVTEVTNPDTGEKKIVEAEVDTGVSARLGRLSWRQIR